MHCVHVQYVIVLYIILSIIIHMHVHVIHVLDIIFVQVNKNIKNGKVVGLNWENKRVLANWCGQLHM